MISDSCNTLEEERVGCDCKSTSDEDDVDDNMITDDIETGSDDSGDLSKIEIEPRLTRSHSVGAINDRFLCDDNMFSFRMPHDSSVSTIRKKNGPNQKSNASAFTSCLPTVGRRNSIPPPTDYNFVLDNYVEYSDDTKIPRLRGKDVDKLLEAIHSSHPIMLCVFATLSCFLTYSISNHTPFLRADISQALVLCLVLATFPEVAASAGAGAFAGMAGSTAIPNFWWLALLALNTSVVWTFFHRHKVLSGCGGRLGTCAFVAMNITAVVFGMPFGAIPWSLYCDNIGSTNLWIGRLELVPSLLTVVASAFLSAVGGFVRLRAKIPLNPVQAPTTIALVCMLVLEPTQYRYIAEIDAGLAVGSFVAMASEQHLPTVMDFGTAGFLAGLWILLLDPFFLEFGGKKGFTSFCGFVSHVLLSKLVALILASRTKNKEAIAGTKEKSREGKKN